MTTHAYRPLDVRLGSVAADTARFHRVRVRWDRIAVAVAAAVLLLAVFTGSVGADGPVPSEAYVVQSGDTLWGIAAERTAAGDDIRETMAAIAEASGLAAGELAVGQELLVPIGG